MQTPATTGRPDDLVDLICGAVRRGDADALEALLARLEAVADGPLLDRLAAAMHAMALIPRRRMPAP